MELGPARSSFGHYSPKRMEGEFSDVGLPLYGVLGSTSKVP